MFQSHVIDVSGTFAGAALSYGGKYRFVAVDPASSCLTAANGRRWPT
jgi:hypothetical protein